MSGPSPTETPPVGLPPLVIAALEREVAGLRRSLRDDPPAVVPEIAVCGIGRERARRTAIDLVRADRPFVVSCGYAGALTDEFRVGDATFPSSVTSEAGETITLSPPRGRAGGPKLFSAHASVNDAASRDALADRTGAALVDMETHAVATVCRDRGIPCVSIRIVTDDVGSGLPSEVARLAPADGSDFGPSEFRRLAIALLARPALALGLFRLARVTAAANRRLAAEVRAVLDGGRESLRRHDD